VTVVRLDLGQDHGPLGCVPVPGDLLDSQTALLPD
jgi:hypothetical protein